MDLTEEFTKCRGRLFAIAYRMLGSAADAEDVVQEAFVCCQSVPVSEIGSAPALLRTIVTRLCINQLQSARHRRETYVGPWLPEPVWTSEVEGTRPAQPLELQESLSLGFLILLEQLTPLERAVFLLREVFDYEYPEIAAILEREEATCRQLLRRARQHIAENRPRFQPTPESHRALLERFARSVTNGDIQGLIALLAEDVVLTADGGGHVKGALLEPLCGAEPVAHFVLHTPRLPFGPFAASIQSVNTQPAMVLRGKDGEVRVVIVLDIDVDGARVRRIRAIANPDKLRWLNSRIELAG